MLREKVQLGNVEFTIESGEVARQASGSVLVHAGETVLFAAVTADRRPSAVDYMPLTVDYRLRFSAAGRIPGSYDWRESRPTDPETLVSRLIDRSIRPFFPAGWSYDTQVMVQPLSFDPASDPSVLGMAAVSAALVLSDVPWDGPIAGVRIGRVDGALVVMPSGPMLERSDLDLVVAVKGDGIVMVEGGGSEVAEDVVLEAFALARRAAEPLLATLTGLAKAGRPKRSVPVRAAADGDLPARARAAGAVAVAAALEVADKIERQRALEAAAATTLGAIADPNGPLDGERKTAALGAIEGLKKDLIRQGVLAGSRIGGRGPSDVRTISGRVGWLARCHGSSLFTRGETQAIVTCTLGSERDAKAIETLVGKDLERFMLHYTFPPYSVGEVKPMRGPGRREIGHGSLARRALLPVLPAEGDAPYTIRLESLITESNGSSSMATVCGGTLAMLDAGLKLTRPVAGIAMGLVKEGDQFVVLSDILGDEDHVGDMDFKVCGTERGVTAIQLDSKLGALPDAVMHRALSQARDGRMQILARMADIIAGPRGDLSPHAPRAAALRIESNRIGGLVGAGGRTVRGLESEFGVTVEIRQDGVVRIFGSGRDAMRRAEERVRDLTGIPSVGGVYQGKVVNIQPFGSFVRLFEGVEGLVPDVALPLGSQVAVRVEGVNRRGKLVLKPQPQA